ncbi:MAG: 4Fe-4S dicluster domain-containing protein [Planctomycetota bacterium]
MAGKIIINKEQCKACGLCISVCPKNCIVISLQSNKKGYFPAESKNSECTGCAMCAIICPEAVIEVQRDNNIKTVDYGKKSKASLSKEKV